MLRNTFLVIPGRKPGIQYPRFALLDSRVRGKDKYGKMKMTKIGCTYETNKRYQLS